MDKIYYLDNAATTKVFEEEYDLLKQNNTEHFYNPSASYRQAINSKKVLEESREKICKAAFANNYNLLFVSSATEANNMLFNCLHLRSGQTVMISKGEHPSVFESANRLKLRGVTVKEIPLNHDGKVDEEKFKLLLDDSVALVSVINVSNETGAINDIKNLCDIVKKYNSKILFHSDGVQAFGKIEVNLRNLGVDLYTISAHKVYAPRGIAGLFIKKGVVIDPLLVGGGQENGMRSSTENVDGALAFAYASEKVNGELTQNFNKVKSLKEELLTYLKNSQIKDLLKVNSTDDCSPYILSLSFDGIKGQVLMNMLESYGVLISTGSACSSKKAGNRILEAMGLSLSEVVGSVRISFSPYMDYDINYIGRTIESCVCKLSQNIK